MEAAMGVPSTPPPLDEKAKRTRDLLASFYSNTSSAIDPNSAAAAISMDTPRSASSISLDSINSPSFDPDSYMSLLVQKSNLEDLLQKHVQMAAEIKNLDTDLQMLVYENYNKFISATDTIKRMKSNIVGMETNMEQLLAKITSVQSKSDTVNTCLFEKREHIEKLHRSRNLLRKVQFIYDLPTRLNKCIKTESYSEAVRFFIGAKPIFEAYGDSSFQDCMRASEEAIGTVIENLKAKLYSDSEPIEARAEAVVLLKQLNFPVDNLKSNLLEKLEECLLKIEESKDASVGDISKTFRAYLIIFPDSEHRLIELAQTLFSRRYDAVGEQLKTRIPSLDLLGMLGVIWEDVIAVDQVLPEAALPALSLEAARSIIKQHISIAFFHLLREISDAVVGSSQLKLNERVEELLLQNALEKSKKAVMQGSIDLLLEFQQFYDEKLELLPKLRDLITDWVQEGFQEFFQNLHQHFLALSRGQESSISETKDKLPTGLVLVLSQLSVFIEQSVIPKITEEIAASFSGVGVRGYEYGPAFVPGEICRLFRSDGEKLLHLYINMKTRKISVLLKKRFTTPIWIKHKEPREVHMFVDLLLQEIESVGMEAKQMLPCGTIKRHKTSDSGSTNSSRSNPNPNTNSTTRSNPTRSRSQFLESHLAKLFEQKLDIFTKVEYTQESVISTVIKLCLKSLQEFVRMQTFNRTGFQQIQLDMEFLKTPLKNLVDDDAVIDFLLKEVNNAAHERCLDPIPLEPPILDRLINAKLAKNKELNSTSL